MVARTATHRLEPNAAGYTYQCSQATAVYQTPDRHAVRCRWCSAWLKAQCVSCAAPVSGKRYLGNECGRCPS